MTFTLTARSYRELDAIVAEHLFGWQWLRQANPEDGIARRLILPPSYGTEDFHPPLEPAEASDPLLPWWAGEPLLYWCLPHYTSWAGMELVAQNRQEAGFWWLVSSPGPALNSSTYFAELTPMGKMRHESKNHKAEGPTEPTARCIAALASVNVTVTINLQPAALLIQT